MDMRVKHSRVCVTPSGACAQQRREQRPVTLPVLGDGTHHTAVRNCAFPTRRPFSQLERVPRLLRPWGGQPPPAGSPPGWILEVWNLTFLSGLGTPLCILAALRA